MVMDLRLTQASNIQLALPCPQCGTVAKKVGIITLKSLLLPKALERVLPQSEYAFCANPDCGVVYFSDQSIFRTTDLKVTVYQKDQCKDTPVCYCFGWTRKRIADEIDLMGESTAVAQVAEHTRAGRCGCDVNNPQGSCCLGNLKAFTENLLSTR